MAASLDWVKTLSLALMRRQEPWEAQSLRCRRTLPARGGHAASVSGAPCVLLESMPPPCHWLAGAGKEVGGGEPGSA